MNQEALPPPMPQLHASCLRCGRTLMNPHSQRRGYGPVCYGKIVAEAREAREALRREIEARG